MTGKLCEPGHRLVCSHASLQLTCCDSCAMLCRRCAAAHHTNANQQQQGTSTAPQALGSTAEKLSLHAPCHLQVTM